MTKNLILILGIAVIDKIHSFGSFIIGLRSVYRSNHLYLRDLTQNKHLKNVSIVS